jgi:NADH:ubiquinone oxidoreductase subunit 6 (subunit J)
MDAKTLALALLAALSLLCAGFAWIVDHPLFSSLSFVLSLVAVAGVIETHWR